MNGRPALRRWEHSGFLLESVELFIGVTNMVFGTADIYDDTVRSEHVPCRHRALNE